jgi:hypothetical protein
MGKKRAGYNGHLFTHTRTLTLGATGLAWVDCATGE